MLAKNEILFTKIKKILILVNRCGIHYAYPKMVIARTRHDDYQYEGIKIVDIANWITC